MIRFEAGRTYSVREDGELHAQLAELYKGLTADEREALELMLAEDQLDLDGKLTAGMPRLRDTVAQIEWREPPVDMKTFLYDDYYLGKTCGEFYEQHFHDLSELFDRGGYTQAIWTGALGYGKSFTASAGMCRVLYEISCMADPHGAYHIAHHSPIHLVCFSVTEDLAIKVAFDYIVEKLQQSPYFQERFPFRKGKKEFNFPNKVQLAARATTDSSALGLNVIAAFLDEGNFIAKPGKAKTAAGEMDRASKIYYQLLRRMKSRFARRGRLPGMLFVVSSKGRSDDFTSKLIESNRSDSGTFCRDYPLWGVKRDSYSEETFHVFVGNETLNSKVLVDAEVPEYQDIASKNDNCVVLEVPETFRHDFETDLEGSIRDLAGIATVTLAPFIQRRDRIKLAADFGDANGLFHPFSVVEYVPGLGGEFLWERLVDRAERPLPGGGYEAYLRPKLNPTAPRFAHIDPSLTGDSTGLCIAHVAGYKEVIRRDSTRKEYREKAPVIVVDLVLRIRPPLGDEIILGDVRQMVYRLIEHGFPITKITMDSYQSIDGIQQMQAKGLDADVLSVDRSPEPYETLKVALYEGRLIFYTYPKLLEELRRLERDHRTGKIDHPPGGSKDVADALAAVCFTLTRALMGSTEPLPLLRGVSYTPSPETPQLQPAAPQADAPETPSPPANFDPLPLLHGGFEEEGNPQEYEP